VIEDFERCYRAVESRDSRFDGWFFTAVTSTGIYCRPSCPAITPKRRNVRFYRSAAAAHAAGFRACRRCRPDAVPGSPEWSYRADVVARAMRLIADGIVDREKVAGLARRLGYSERQLQRLLTDEVGAGPLALARAQRASTARVLIETTATPFSEVAFAAGFSSVRQFNDTIQAVFALTPSQLRQRAASSHDQVAAPGLVQLRLAYRSPLDADGLLGFFRGRAVTGIEEVDDTTYRRTLPLPHGAGVAELTPADGAVVAVLHLDDIRDLTAAVERCRWLLDLDADPLAVDGLLSRDPSLRGAIRRHPGRRVPHTVDAIEMAVRAVIGQQVSVAGARTLAGRMVQRLGKPLTRAHGSLTHLVPSADVLAGDDLPAAGMPTSRAATVRSVAERIASGELPLDRGADWEQARATLGAIKGIGPWTTSYIAMRALGDPDAFPSSDLGLRKAAARLGVTAGQLDQTAVRWRPWRAYAAEYLWSTLEDPT